MSRLRVYFHEFNIRMGRFCYLPIVSGILRAYAETDPAVKEGYEFMPFLYAMDSVPNIWKNYEHAPDVAAFSVSMWNEQLCLEVARGLKETYGNSVLTVFGGYSVPHHAAEYMGKCRFIDVCVRSEGEETFKAILKRRLEWSAGRDGFEDVPGLTFRTGGGEDGYVVENKQEWPYQKDLDLYPSPYLENLFDPLVAKQSDELGWQAIIETNRGCSFPCSFCAWGRGGTTTRYRFHSLERVKAEIDWCGRNGMQYVFNADANFGMHPRDKEIAEYLVETKRRWGKPQRFRTCFGKNTDEKIFQVATLLHSADMEKGITLARQSNDETTLKNIRRQNISLATYRNLQERFNAVDIPVYVELILGLPGETAASWKKGIDDCLTKAGSRNNLFVYLCQVLTNTELADPEYRKTHGIRTRRIELQEIHGSPRGEEWVREFEEIVVATNSMPHNDWREMCKFSWATMLLHSMKAGFFVMAWLWDRFKIPPSELIAAVAGQSNFYGNLTSAVWKERERWENLLDEMTVFGAGRGQVLPNYGTIYWDVEEAALLRLSESWGAFYQDLEVYTRYVLNSHENETGGAEYVREELKAVLEYQSARMPRYYTEEQMPLVATWTLLDYNVPEYFDKLFGNAPVPLVKKPQVLTLKPKTFPDKATFAQQTVLWGRKSGTMLVPCEWRNE